MPRLPQSAVPFTTRGSSGADSAGAPDGSCPGASAAATPSLEGLNRSVDVPAAKSGFWRQWLAFSGPAILVSVGYMDPGNWGTDLQAGATYRYGLLWVVALASLMAIFMQVCAARLGVVMRKDLAQACREHYPAWTRWPNWLSCELAIAATDLAEVLGGAVALKMLFGIPLFWAVVITAFDVLVLLALQGLGMRLIEALVLVLVATIGVCYFIEVFIFPQTTPSFAEMGYALLQPRLDKQGMVYLAIGIIGATVMPHNLYLHSALVQSRRIAADEPSVRRALWFNTLDSIVALSVAFLVNAAILVLAAIVFHERKPLELPGGEVVTFTKDADWIQVAYLTLAPLLGKASASVLFAVALLASGQSSTITGTMAGQVVMEGFLRLAHPSLGPAASDPAGRHRAGHDHHLPARRTQPGDRPAEPEPGLPGPAIAAGHGSAPALDQLPEIHGKLRQRLVPAHRRLGELRAHHRPGHLGPAGSVQNRLERNRGE